MKSLKLFTLSILVALVFVSSVNAQFTINARRIKADNYGLQIEFKGSLDTLGTTNDTLVSAPFSIDEYDGYDNLEYGIVLGNAGNVNVGWKLYHSYFSSGSATPATCAGLMVAASLTDSLKVKTETTTYKALVGIRGSYYRLLIYNRPGGRKTTTFDLIFDIPKKDVVILPVGGK